MLKTTNGVTLIELLLVIVIMGVLVTITLPAVDVTRYRIDAELQAVSTTLLVAQQYAVSRQHDVIVQFEAGQRSLVVHYDGDNDGQMDTGERVRRTALGDAVAFGLAGASPRPMGAGPITFQPVNGLPSVTFHRNGSASEAGGLYLTSRRALADPGHATDTRAIEVERGTGRVSWWRWSGAQWERGS